MSEEKADLDKTISEIRTILDKRIVSQYYHVSIGRGTQVFATIELVPLVEWLEELSQYRKRYPIRKSSGKCITLDEMIEKTNR